MKLDFLSNIKRRIQEYLNPDNVPGKPYISPMADDYRRPTSKIIPQVNAQVPTPSPTPRNRYVPQMPENLRAPIDQATTSAIPSDLLSALAYQENRDFATDAVSPAGARGLFQFTPVTLRELVRLGHGEVDPDDPYQSARAASFYLQHLLNQFDDELPLALAAYNAGPGNVKKYKGVPPFKETQNYVRSILKYMKEAD